MATSKIELCNVSLGMLGAAMLRSFDEKNKRARMAEIFFDFTRDYLLSKFDWPFARKLAKLQPIDTAKYPSRVIPEGLYPYQMPNDCHTARDLYPRGSNQQWEVMEDWLYCKIDPDNSDGVLPKLFYTALIVDVAKYSRPFNNLLTLGLAVKLCPSVTQDKQLTQALYEQFVNERTEAWESEANVGEDYRSPDEDPNNDTFVYPDGYLVEEDEYFRQLRRT